MRRSTVPAGLSARQGVRVHVDGYMRQLRVRRQSSVTVRVSPAPSGDRWRCGGSGEPVRWVFERARASPRACSGCSEHGDVSVARERQPISRCEPDATCTLCRKWLERGRTYVYTVVVALRQLQCDVEQRDGDGESLRRA